MTSAGKPPMPPGRGEGAPRGAAGTAGARGEITSGELLGGNREVRIRHADEIYTLRQTNKGKLILTK